MKILIISTMTNNFGKRGAYNSQEIGLARGLESLGHSIQIYKAVTHAAEEDTVEISKNIVIYYIKCFYLGSNGFLDTNKLDKSADRVIQFSDVQLSVPYIYSWCKRNHKIYLPYIGISWSQSNNKFVRCLIDFMAERNINIYKECKCFVKTEQARHELLGKGIKDIQIAPVCLDFNQLHKDYERSDIEELKKKWKVKPGKCLLFIGRFESDKHPLEVLEVYKKVCAKYSMLIMVGRGILENKIREKIRQNSLEDKILLISSVPNDLIWELYRISDFFINLNPNEIWGMSLLEAMYYKVPIAAIDAPGPRAMITNGKTGYICSGYNELIDKLMSHIDTKEIKNSAYEHVCTTYDWINTAALFVQ